MSVDSVKTPTTWMLKHVHSDHTSASLHALLSTLVDGTSYNLLFLPWILKKDKNVGFAFVNFLTGDDAAKAVDALRNKSWPDTRQKVIEVHPAVVQGFEANVSNCTKTRPAPHALLFLHNGKQISEQTAMSLYSSQSFAVNRMLQGQQTEETEGDSSSSRSDSLQEIIKSFGVPVGQPFKTQPAAVPTQWRSTKEVLNTHPKGELNDFARWRLESKMNNEHDTGDSFDTSPTLSRSGSTSSRSRNTAASESLTGRTESARQTSPAPAWPATLQPMPDSQTVRLDQTSPVSGHRCAMPVRTPPASMRMAMASRNAPDMSMFVMQDSVFEAMNLNSSSGQPVPSRNSPANFAHRSSPNPVRKVIRMMF